MQTPWKKLENEKGFPFYYNSNTGQKQWDHPKFIEIKHLVNDCNYVKYSKYRVALKFRTLQKALFMEGVTLATIIGIFNKHQLGTNESSFCLEGYDLEAILYDIYFAANKLNKLEIDIDFAVELMQNFLYNIFDKERQVKIQVSSTKLALGLLSDCDLSDLINFLFTLCADHNNCVTRLRLQSLLMKLVEISVFMHEDVSFGQHLINATIENCFSNSPGLVGLCQSNFLTWVEEAPMILCWIPILHRIKTSETMVHNTKCATCKSNPVMGLIYKCIKCTKYTQCQRCFFMGRTSHSHKLSHSMREYSSMETSSREFTFNFVKKLCGFVNCTVKSDQSELGINYPTTTTLTYNNLHTVNTVEDYLMKSSPPKDYQPPTSPESQLQLIIKHLETQNRELHRILLFNTHSEQEIRKYLQEHKLEIAGQIHKLKILKNYLQIAPNKNTLESTPMVGMGKFQHRPNIEMFSPIIQLPNGSEHPMTDPSLSYSVNDISTWIKDQPGCSKGDDKSLVRHSPVRELHNDLDDALAKLQQILANNFTLDESLGNIDNNHLKHAVSEVEGVLTSIIDNVESNSVQNLKQS